MFLAEKSHQPKRVRFLVSVHDAVGSSAFFCFVPTFDFSSHRTNDPQNPLRLGGRGAFSAYPHVY